MQFNYSEISWLSTMPGFQYQAQYAYVLKNRWKIGAGFEFAYACATDASLEQSSGYKEPDMGAMTDFSIKPKQQTMIGGDLFVAFSAIKSAKTKITLDVLAGVCFGVWNGVGISKLYRNETPTALNQPYDTIEPTYKSSADMGCMGQLKANYLIGNSFYIGINAGIQYYFASEIYLFPVGGHLGVRF